MKNLLNEPLDIEDLIENEQDRSKRTLLLLIHRISLSLYANTKATEKIERSMVENGDKLDGHITNFEEHKRIEEGFINRGKGAWKILAWVLGIAQTIGVLIFLNVSADINQIHNVLENDKVQHVEFKSKIETIEQKLSQKDKR